MDSALACAGTTFSASNPQTGKKAMRHLRILGVGTPLPFGARLVVLVIALGMLAGGGNAAHSQVLVDGKHDTVHIEARDVSLQEVLDALQAKFNLHYRTSDVLDTRMSGTFNGPLRRVAARILDSYDFAMKITPQGIDVLILRQHASDAKPVAATTPARAIAEGSPARVMTAAEANRYERGQVR
jgi:hypothetical protein